jgi:hypothetical protein
LQATAKFEQIKNFSPLISDELHRTERNFGPAIRFDSSTNADALYRKLKVEDAMYACKATLRGGM